MPKVFVEDFTTHYDEEFVRKAKKWLKLTVLSAPSKLSNPVHLLLLLGPLWFIWIMYIISMHLSSDFITKYLLLNIHSPTLTSMFFTNFLHLLSSPQHIISTSGMFLISAACVIVLNTRRRPIVEITSVIFLLILPIQLSAVSVLLLPYLGIESYVGFSGIACAFFGYACYLIIITMWNFAITYNYGKYEAIPWFYVNKFLLGTMAIILLPIAYYITEYLILNVHTNPVVHIIGFVCGLTIPQLIGIYVGTSHNKKMWRIGAMLTLLLILFAPIILVAIKYL